jgi:hypothetical protein
MGQPIIRPHQPGLEFMGCKKQMCQPPRAVPHQPLATSPSLCLPICKCKGHRPHSQCWELWESGLAFRQTVRCLSIHGPWGLGEPCQTHSFLPVSCATFTEWDKDSWAPRVALIGRRWVHQLSPSTSPSRAEQGCRGHAGSRLQPPPGLPCPSQPLRPQSPPHWPADQEVRAWSTASLLPSHSCSQCFSQAVSREQKWIYSVHGRRSPHLVSSPGILMTYVIISAPSLSLAKWPPGFSEERVR